MGAIVGDLVASVEVEHAVKEIGQSWHKAVESIIETSNLLYKYKQKKNIWNPLQKMLIERGIMHESVISMLVGIGGNALLVNEDNFHLLPPSYNTLYQLSKLDEGVLEEKISCGDVHTGITIEIAKKWRKETEDLLPTRFRKDDNNSQFIPFARINIQPNIDFNDKELRNELSTLKERYPFLDISFETTNS